ncbi:YihY/virulence factor BrkB family protein [Butyrivibrio sp. INlla21]|uniref:YihY/virulence factor BrkB family protein n=1 Tax=Butyrivibrio sp. INlla21 TaxID=1520811 RepID=UPI0008EBA408|nr:YihY/virulence factor BrkB family protein [Butyrivibrio sp. INlla21]SFV03738.1 membrane protein [Butyrivibrio sp. INlla21]
MNIWGTLFSLMRNFSRNMQKKNIVSYASSTAFFLIVSLIPLLIMITSVLPYTPITEADMVRAFIKITPSFTDETIISFINEAYGRSDAVFSISALVTLWTGSLGMLALMRGLNCIYDVEELRNVIYLRILAAFYTVAMIAIVLMMLLLMVFGNRIEAFIIGYYPPIGVIVSFLINFRFILIIGIAIFLFALMYTYIPSARLRYVYQLPGAVFSAIVWYAFSWIFSMYVNSTDSYSLYGSLATPVIMMFWLYFCIYIFLIGAFINKFFHPAVKVLYDDHHKKVVRLTIKESQ